MEKTLTKNQMREVQERIGYNFYNQSLLIQAFTRKSFTEENGTENNEVLEFIGDKALDLVVIRKMMEYYGKYLYDDDFHYGEFITLYDEGEFTELKKSLVEKKALSKFMNNLGFHEYLIMGKGDKERNIQNQPSVKEDLFEAILGAVALDSEWDLERLTEVCSNMIDFNSFFGSTTEEGLSVFDLLVNQLKKTNIKAPTYNIIKENDNYICKLNFQGTLRNFYGEGNTEEIALNRSAYLATDYITNEQSYKSELQEAIGYPDYDTSANTINELQQKKLINDVNYSYHEDLNSFGNPIWSCALTIKEYDKTFSAIAHSKIAAKKTASFLLIDYIFEDNINYDYFTNHITEISYEKYVQLKDFQSAYFHITEAIFQYGYLASETYVYKEKMDLLNKYVNSQEYLDDIKTNDLLDHKYGISFNCLKNDKLKNLVKELIENEVIYSLK